MSLQADEHFFKLIFIRHEKPYYKDVGHDLTPEGVVNAKKIGKKLIDENIIDKNKSLYLFHSPLARARGTLEFISEEAGLQSPFREVEEIRSSDFKDLEYFLQREKDLGFTLEDMAREHYLNEDFYNSSPHIIETNDNKRKRLYYFLESIIVDFIDKKTDSSPQIIAVSHFEVIMHLIQDVFGIENFDTYMTPALGEILILYAKPTDDLSKIEFNVHFRNKNNTVIFDRKNKIIIKS